MTELDSGIPTGATPLFSVIVPTRNRPETIERTLDGIRAQSFADYEAVIVDDGSTGENLDRLQAILAEFDGRFRLVHASAPGQKGSGPSGARNFGIGQAKGTFIAFCDDDDHWSDAGHLAAAAEALRAVPTADLYIANQIAVCEGKVTIPDWLPQVSAVVPQRDRVTRDAVRLRKSDLTAPGSFGHLNICIYRRDLVGRLGGFWEKVAYEEDLDFFLRGVDAARDILFRKDVVSVHNVPDRTRQANASTRLGAFDKWMNRATVCQHVRTAARDRSVIDAASSMEGSALRHVAQDLLKEGRAEAALSFALQALAARLSAKWLAYTCYLRLKVALARLSAGRA